MSIKFIEDKEFDLSKPENQDLLGTKPYAETLFEVVKESQGKQNIGLFGGWGSGKSTIIATLENFIADHNADENKKDKIAFFKYDAWKYSKDDFRRSFLKSFNSQVEVLKEDAINEILYKEVVTQDVKRDKLKVNYDKITPLIIGGIVLFLIIIAFILPKLNDDLKSILVLVSILASFIFYLSRDLFRVVPFTVKQLKLVEPERFEETFKLMVHRVFGENESWMTRFKNFFAADIAYKKLVIVIDNLDRCDNANLKETLVTMKNFLESENVIFILPVDENGIISFLDSDTEQAEEYLRKIFHQIIRLKKFTPKELVDFTKKLNEKYDLKLSNTGIRLICQEFTTNPRKIIQFLNNFQTEKDLIIRQIREEYINLDFNQQANDFLIKLLIIKQEWGPIYKRLLDDINFLNKINIGLKNVIEQKNLAYVLNTGKQKITLTRDQKRFFKRNMDVHFNNVEPFVLNIDRDKDVPDELRGHIENGELNEIFELLSIDINEDVPVDKAALILHQIESVYDYNDNKFDDYKFIARPVSEILFELVKYSNFKNEIITNFKNLSFIKRIFSDNQFTGLINDLGDFKKYCEASLWFYKNLDFSAPYDRLIRYLNDSLEQEDPKRMTHIKTRKFIEVFEQELELLEKLSENLTDKIIEKPNLLNSYVIFKTNIKVANAILNDEFFDQMIDLLLEDKIENENTLERFIYLIDRFIKEDYLTDKEVITKYTNYYVKQTESEYARLVGTPKGIFKLSSLINKLSDLVPKSELDNLEFDETLIAGINSKLSSEYTTALDEDEIKFYITFLDLVWDYMCLDDDFCTSENTAKYFNTFFEKNDFDKLSLAINKIYTKDIKKFGPYRWNFFDSLIEKLKVKKRTIYMKTLMLMYNKTTSEKGLSNEQKIELFERLIVLYNYWNSNEPIRLNIKEWLEIAVNKDKSLYQQSIEGLSSVNLERYVYRIHKLESEKFIANSFDLFLSEITEYPKFKKFMNHLYKYFSSSIQYSTIMNCLNSGSISDFDWIFSSKKYVHKQAFNDLIKQYLKKYENDKKFNSNYLKNLLKLDKNNLYSTTKKMLSEFVKNMSRPTLYHRAKIEVLKQKLSL